MGIAGYELRKDGGSPVDVGNVLTHTFAGLTANTSYNFEVRSYDYAGNRSAWSSIVAVATNPRYFDTLSMSHVGIWDLSLRRTAYAGKAVRAGLTSDSGATQIDIGFDGSGNFDMAAYTAFGTGSERIVKWYDQSGNGFDLSRAWSATLCPIIRTSSYNSKPCVYFNGTGSLGNSGFTDWNGLTNVNVVATTSVITLGLAGMTFVGGADVHAIYGPDSTPSVYCLENGFTTYNLFSPVWERHLSGDLWRYKYNGGASASDRLTLYNNNKTYDTSIAGTDPGTTFTNATGIWINAESNGTSNAKDNEYFGVSYIGQNIDSTWTALKSETANLYYSFTSSMAIGSGDSLTVSYNLNSGDPTHTYPEQLEVLLEAFTGTAWNIPDPTSPQTAEVAAALFRIMQLGRTNGPGIIDDWQQHRIALCWGGTNDLAYAAIDPAKVFTVDHTTGIFTAATHGFLSGLCVHVSNGGGALPTGLSAGTDYSVIVIDANTFYLATSITNAVAGTHLSVSSDGTGTNTATPTTSPAMALEGSALLAQNWLDYGASKVYYLNMLPRQDLGAGNTAFETARTTYNAGLAAALPGGVTMIDVASISQLANPLDTTYYNSDKVHLVLAGYTLIAQAVAAAIEADL